MADRPFTAQRHPDYLLHEATWRKLRDVVRGDGGFLTGAYLVAHPREWEDHDAVNPSHPTRRLKARRALARYENIAAMVLGSKHGALFRQAPTRTMKSENADLTAWRGNVDGRGCSLDDYLADNWTEAAALGHVLILTDIDANGSPYLASYTALDLIDWLTAADGTVTSVMLLELAPRADFAETVRPFRVRVIDQERWTLYESDGTRLKSGEHALGRLPVTMLYTSRPPRYGLVGQSVLHDPQLFIDHYNLTSELRDLLRAQTFGILNIPLGTGTDAASVEQAQAMIGQTIGNRNVMFSPEAARYISPDAANVAAYQAERADLMRTIFRLCNVPYESDSRDAESAASLQLKREDMNVILSGYADFLEQAEYDLVDLWYRARYGADAGPRRLAADGYVVRYPDTFEMRPVQTVLQDMQLAFALPWAPEVMAELQRRNLDVVLPDLPQDRKKALEAAIDQHAQLQANPMERIRRSLNVSTKASTTLNGDAVN